MNYDGKVGKIVDIEEAQREYDILSSLPSSTEVDLPMPYINNQDVNICPLTSFGREIQSLKDTNRHVREELERISTNDYQIIMADLGKDFSSYLSVHFKNPMTNSLSLSAISQDFNKKGRIMSFFEFKKIMNSLFVLYRKIDNMNKMGIFHMDIKGDNIMYNEEQNNMVLIDFGLSLSRHSKTQKYKLIYKTEETFFYEDKILFLKKVLLPFLYLAMGNKNIYESFKQDAIRIEELEKTIFFASRPILSPKHKKKYVFDKDIPILKELEHIKGHMEEIDDMETEPNPELKIPLSKPKQRTYEEQRLAGQLYNQQIKETASMGKEDKKGGMSRKSKKYKRKTKRTKESKNHSPKANRRNLS